GAALLSMTACATGTPIAGQTIDDSYRVDGFRWDSGTTVYVMLKTFNADGKTGVCGAWTARGGSSNISHLNTEMMDAGSVALDGTTLVNGLGFMKEHGGTGDLKGQASNCVKTDVDWQPAFANERPDAVFPRMRFVL
ncbi:MAG: hypothetical protein AAFV19_03465, partial [Pseudomonadota bacterium]